MDCPGCNATLIAIEFTGVELDFCSHCGGVWLDRGELADILDLAEVESGGITEALYDSPDLGAGKGQCPRCDRRLRRVALGAAEQTIEIDRCPDHHGLWLDRGEIRDVVGWFGQEKGRDTGAVADLFNEMFGHDLRSNDEETPPQ